MATKEIEELIVLFGNANFDCGADESESLEQYDPLVDEVHHWGDRLAKAIRFYIFQSFIVGTFFGLCLAAIMTVMAAK